MLPLRRCKKRQGLERPTRFRGSFGTAEAVPCYKAPCTCARMSFCATRNKKQTHRLQLEPRGIPPIEQKTLDGWGTQCFIYRGSGTPVTDCYAASSVNAGTGQLRAWKSIACLFAPPLRGYGTLFLRLPRTAFAHATLSWAKFSASLREAIGVACAAF